MKDFFNWKLKLKVVLTCLGLFSLFASSGVVLARSISFGGSQEFRFNVFCERNGAKHPLKGAEVLLVRRDGDFLGMFGTLNPYTPQNSKDTNIYKKTVDENGKVSLTISLKERESILAGVYFWGIYYG